MGRELHRCRHRQRHALHQRRLRDASRRRLTRRTPMNSHSRARQLMPENSEQLLLEWGVQPTWTEDGSFTWTAHTRNGRRFRFSDLTTKQTEELFDHDMLAARLRDATGDDVTAE